MKRARELEEVVGEIVEAGRAKNEKGELIYPVMREPLVLALFGAPEALVDVLRARPGLVLNLMQTNKALSQFLEKFDRLWIILMDELVEREMGTYASEVYPFIMVSQRRRIKSQGGGEVGLFGYYSEYTQRDVRQFKLVEIGGRYFRPTSTPHYIAYHDPLTLIYFELIDRIVRLGTLQSFTVSDMHMNYIGITERHSPHIVNFGDFFLMDNMSRNTLKRKSYDLGVMRVQLERMAHFPESYVVGRTLEGEGVEITKIDKTTKKRENLGIYPSSLSDELLCVQKLVAKLQLALAEPNLVLEPIVPLTLDKNLATPYRTLLYDAKQGLYPTQEAQKDFFMLLFNDLARPSGTTEITETIEAVHVSLSPIPVYGKQAMAGWDFPAIVGSSPEMPSSAPG